MSTSGIQRFFVDALGGALEGGLATPEDVIKHVTPDVLAANLPRAIWAKLLDACLKAPRVDARLVVDTIGLVDLAANMPGVIMWNIVADVAVRALGKGIVAAPPPPAVSDSKSGKVAAPVEDKSEKAPDKSEKASDKAPDKVVKAADKAPAPVEDKKPVEKFPENKTPVPPLGAKAPVTRPSTSPGFSTVQTASPRAVTATTTTTSAPPAPAPPATPLPQAMIVDIDFEDDDEPAPLDAPPQSPHRAPTVPGPAAGAPARPAPGNGARPSSGAGASSRRPQASTSPRTTPRTTPPSPRRGPAVSSDFDLDTDVGSGKEIDIPVDDDQLVDVDWAASEETVTSDPDRKR